jgi:hypothetical protein
VQGVAEWLGARRPEGGLGEIPVIAWVCRRRLPQGGAPLLPAAGVRARVGCRCCDGQHASSVPGQGHQRPRRGKCVRGGRGNASSRARSTRPLTARLAPGLARRSDSEHAAPGPNVSTASPHGAKTPSPSARQAAASAACRLLLAACAGYAQTQRAVTQERLGSVGQGSPTQPRQNNYTHLNRSLPTLTQRVKCLCCLRQH